MLTAGILGVLRNDHRPQMVVIRSLGKVTARSSRSGSLLKNTINLMCNLDDKIERIKIHKLVVKVL